MKPRSILHRKSLWTSIIVMLLISLAMVPIVAEAEINSTGTYFWVDPPTNIVEEYCHTFPVKIMIEDAPTTYAWEATLKFDNNTLGVMSVTEGPWLKATTKPTQFLTTSLVEANKTGTISMGCTLKGNETEGTSGSGLLCTIVFHVEYCGRSPLDLQDTALLDMNLVRTEYPNNDGFFCAVCAVECLHDVAIVDVTVNETQVQQGDQVGITVTIKNEGNHTQHVTVTVSAIYELDPEEFIGSNSCINIDPDQTIPVKFDWDTTNVPGEKYNIKAVVVKDGTDDDPHDNIFIGPEVHVICPHDVKVTKVKVLTPWVYVCSYASVEITVVNEGKNTESFNVEVYADTSKVCTVGVVNLLVNETRAVICTWHADTPGIYVISAKVPPVAGGTEKDTADNEKVDGILIVIYDDLAVTIATLNVTEIYWGYSVGVEITIFNNGTDYTRFTVNVWADPTPGAPFSDDEILVGLIPGGALAANTSHTFVGLEPWLCIETMKRVEPYDYLVPCTDYGIFVEVIKLYGFDLNPNNDVFDAGMLSLKRILGDVDGDNDVDVGDQRKTQLAMFSLNGTDLTPPPDEWCQPPDEPGKWQWNNINQYYPNWGYNYWNTDPIFADVDGDGDVDVGDQRKQQLWMMVMYPPS